MCGICGIVQPGHDNQSFVERMCRMLAHRGPEHSAVYQSGNTCLGHRRLSIIDLKTGNQPIYNQDKKLAIVYNGEIYNYRELKTELTKRGAQFKTQSDTEVVLKLYEIHGVDSFHRLNGIFSFAILDERGGQPQLVLARDHFGVKPLHYYQSHDLFLFASEQKAILTHPDVPRELNPQALHHQINLRYNQGDETLFKGLFRCPPAHFMIVQNGRVKRTEPYFALQPHIDYQKSEKDWLAEIPQMMKQAVKRQLVSDVPIGVYLSGGLDSGSIVAMMREAGVQDINTFTLGFNEPTDEIDDAEQTANRYQTNHHVLRMDLNPMRFMPEVMWHAEEPKINLLQGYLMSDFVSKHLKVALGGLGGDELFSGYDIHKFILPFNRLHGLVPRQAESAIGSKLSALLYSAQTKLAPMRFDEYRRGLQMALATGNLTKFYLILRNVWDYDRKHWQNIYSPSFLQNNIQPVKKEFEPLFERINGLTSLDQVYFAEVHSKMVNDYLLVEDRMSMAHSLEERVPFLDVDFVKFGFSIPAKMKMRGTETKYLMRKAMQPYLPERIIRKKKWGFTFNPYLQFQKDLRDTAERILTKPRIEKDGIFNYSYIRSILDAKPHPRLRWHYNFIWILTGFYIWKRMYLETTNFESREFDIKAYFSS